MIKSDSLPHSLPEISAIYRVWHQGQVVYVGKAANLKQRWMNHHIYPKLYCAYGADWTVDWVPVRPSHLNRAEAFAYRHFKPILNQIDPSTQLGKTQFSKTASMSS